LFDLRPGEAGPGTARPGTARRGWVSSDGLRFGSTPNAALSWRVAARFGAAARGEAWLGEAGVINPSCRFDSGEVLWVVFDTRKANERK